MQKSFAIGDVAVTKFLATNIELILFAGAVVAAYALFRLTQVRDADGQKLPHSVTAKLFFVLTHVLIYFFFLGLCLYSPELLSGLPGMPDVIPDELRQQLPLIAVIALGALLTIPQVKELDRQYAVLLHSAQHKRADEEALRIHLASCPFHPSDQEIEESLQYLRQFDLYITDRDTESIQLESVETWRKVSSLLRFLKSEAMNDKSVLSATDRQDVVRLEEAHFRKTKLATSMIRILDHIEKGSQYSQRLTRVASILSDASHSDRTGVGIAENVAQQIMNELELSQAAGDGVGSEPLRLSSKQVQQYVAQIESYLKAEYQLMLQDASRLAAKMIIRSGDRAPAHLDEAKGAGFGGLGEIQEVNLDRVILVIMATFPTVFFFFTMSALWSGRPARPELYISIATTISIAALIGAMWGSRRRFAQAREIPWSSYLAAGLVAVGGFVVVQCTRYFIDPEAVVLTGDETLGLGGYLRSVLPWSATAAFVAMGTCGLARVDAWPWHTNNAIVERTLDGAFLGLAFCFGQLASYVFHTAFQTGFGVMIVKRMSDGQLDWLLSSSIRGFLIGFVMGFFIVRDIRRVAHSHVVLPRSPERTKAASGSAGAAPPRHPAEDNVVPLAGAR